MEGSSWRLVTGGQRLVTDSQKGPANHHPPTPSYESPVASHQPLPALSPKPIHPPLPRKALERGSHEREAALIDHEPVAQAPKDTRFLGERVVVKGAGDAIACLALGHAIEQHVLGAGRGQFR